MDRAEQHQVLADLTAWLDRPIVKAVLAEQAQVETDTAAGTVHLYDPWAMKYDGTQPAECGGPTGITTRVLDATLATCAACVTARVDAEIAHLAAEDVRRSEQDERDDYDGPDVDPYRAEYELDRVENAYATRMYQEPKQW